MDAHSAEFLELGKFLGVALAPETVSGLPACPGIGLKECGSTRNKIEMKNTLVRLVPCKSGRFSSLLPALAVGALTVGSAMAQTGSGNEGADAIITEVSGLTPVAVAVISAAVLVVIVPWGAKMAIKAWHAICG